ncbi:hypothetical protein CDL12_05457 [Handroanthus impetiginosus]|uniref:UBA domain-containing protein n=1 Tax=Handroanthus impetiginosus TaxID=429701 RepID=A0A2G9HWD2_9LAMI|nr:hypothetical protein CDL12_05457 [Handroanthus impetiginosus]
MNNNTASQFMDKQIMDLSNSQSPGGTDNNSISSNNDFINLMNPSTEKKDDIVPSYDFMPIRPAVGSSSPKAVRSSNFDAVDGDAPLRTWNSFDSKTNTSSIRNYSSVDADEPAKFILGKNHKSSNVPSDVSLVSEIDRTMKKYMDILMHSVDHMSARLSQLETRSRNLENSIDDLKVSVEKTHGSTDEKMRVLEDILSEVQSSVQIIKDKQEIVEAQLQIAKVQVSPKVEQVQSKNTTHSDSTQTGVSSNQQFSAISPAHPSPNLPPPNAPPPPPQQNLQHQVPSVPNQFPQNQVPSVPNQFPQNQVPSFPNQFPQGQVPSVPQRESYFPPPGQTPENPSQHYQIPPPQQQQHLVAPPPPQQQYQAPPQPQYSQPPPTSQPHPSFSAVNPSLPQTPLGHHPEETPHIPAPTYTPQGIRPPPSHPSTGVPPPPSQQYYGPTSNVYDPPSIRPGPGYSGSFPSSGHGEPYPYSSSPSQYGSGSPVKPQQLPSQSGVSSYPQLPTARILPQALPTASAVGSGSGSGGSSNRVPIDDVVDRVTNMGFPRDQVRATVRKLTENGQAVDLNVVLDKLMNDGEGQAPRAWFGR